MLMTSSEDPLTFRLPPPQLERKLVIDSAKPLAPESEVGDTVEVEAHAVVIIVGRGGSDVVGS